MTKFDEDPDGLVIAGSRTPAGEEFADRNTQAGAEIHVRTGLDHPAAKRQPTVDRRPRHILRVKCRLVHGGNLRV